MHADNGLLHRKLRETTSDDLMFLDDELGNSQQLKISLEFVSCDYSEHAGKGEGILTHSTEVLVKTDDQSVSLLISTFVQLPGFISGRGMT